RPRRVVRAAHGVQGAQRHSFRFDRFDPGTDASPQEGAALHSDFQRESPGRQPVGLVREAVKKGTAPMLTFKSRFALASIAFAGLTFAAMPPVAGQQPAAA